MFERFDDEARRAVVLAQEEARMLNHNYIGTEHILLGLTHQGSGVAAKTLESMGVALEAVREQVEEIIGRGQTAPSGYMPFTPRTKRVLQLSADTASESGDDDVGSKHVLIGLLGEGQGVGAQVLQHLGVDLDRVRQQAQHGSHNHGDDQPDNRPTIRPQPGRYRRQSRLERVTRRARKQIAVVMRRWRSRG